MARNHEFTNKIFSWTFYGSMQNTELRFSLEQQFFDVFLMYLLLHKLIVCEF